MQVLSKCSLCGQYSINNNSDNENLKQELKQFRNLKRLSLQFKNVPEVFNKLNEYNDCIDQLKRENGNYKEIMNIIQRHENEMFFMMGKLNQKCDYCSERLTLSAMEESALEDYGYQLYEEYYTLMTSKGNKLPRKIKIKVVEADTPYIGSCSYDDILKIWVIEINMVEGYSKHSARTTFAHEFGHLLFDYDDETGGKKDDVSLWNSEYFAAEIEMQEYLKHDILKERKIRATDRLIYDSRTYLLKDHLLDKLKSYIREIKCKCDDGLNDMSIISILRSAVWYRSKINFVRKYIDESSIECIPNITEIEEYLANRYGADDPELCTLLKQLNDNIVGDYADIDSNLLSNIFHKVNFQLSTHIPGREYFRSREAMFKHIMGDNYSSEIMENINKEGAK